MAMVTAVMVATGTLITVDTAAMEVMVTVVMSMVVPTDMVTRMATGTGTVAIGTDMVTVIGGMVAGGPMVWVPAGDWFPAAGFGFATDRGTPDPIAG